MKKILTAITATAILATGAFSTEKNNVYLINNLEQKLVLNLKILKMNFYYQKKLIVNVLKELLLEFMLMQEL